MSNFKCLKIAPIYYFTVLEDRCLKLKCQQGHTFSEVSKKNSSLPLSAPGGYPCSFTYRSIIPAFASIFIWIPPLCLCVSFLLLKGTSVIGLRSTLMQYGLFLTWLYMQWLFLRSHSEIPGGYEFLGNSIQSTVLWCGVLFAFNWFIFTSILPVVVDRLIIANIKIVLAVCQTYSNLSTYIHHLINFSLLTSTIYLHSPNGAWRHREVEA